MATGPFTAFQGQHQIGFGDLAEVAAAAFEALRRQDSAVLIFDDLTGQTVELDLRHSAELAVAGYKARYPAEVAAPDRQGRGRPRLGVVAREVTLLPRHWDWLARQPGGASAALRRLVEDARRAGAEPDRRREGQKALYQAMSVLAGDLPEFESATRALFANDPDGLDTILEGWPRDISGYLRRLWSNYRD